MKNQIIPWLGFIPTYHDPEEFEINQSDLGYVVRGYPVRCDACLEIINEKTHPLIIVNHFLNTGTLKLPNYQPRGVFEDGAFYMIEQIRGSSLNANTPLVVARPDSKSPVSDTDFLNLGANAIYDRKSSLDLIKITRNLLNKK